MEIYRQKESGSIALATELRIDLTLPDHTSFYEAKPYLVGDYLVYWIDRFESTAEGWEKADFLEAFERVSGDC